MSYGIESLLQSTENARIVRAKVRGYTGTEAEGNLDMVGFITLLQDMLAVDAPKVVIVPAYPKYLKVGTPENAKTIDNPTATFSPTITYKRIRREPATTGGNKQPFGTGYKEFTPKLRAELENADGSKTLIFGQNFDNLIRFNTWSLTNFEAEELVNWFEQYLRTRRVFLRNQGLGEILFWSGIEEMSSAELTLLDNRLERRTLTFYIRTEELSETSEDVLKNLEIKMGIR